jgi:hypothetical protein
MPMRPWWPRSRRVPPELAATGARAPLTPDRLEGSLRIGYVVWDWPALSQTFVLNEIRELQSRGHDVVVYFKVWADQQARLTFDVAAHQVQDAEHLRRLLVEHGRQVMHSPFAYPSTTLLVWPAAKATGIPFTFMAGGVDVAHYANMERNRVGEVASAPECLGVVTLGTFHRDLLLGCGVPSHRIVMERQSAALPDFASSTGGADRPTLVSVGRFIEKKGSSGPPRCCPRSTSGSTGSGRSRTISGRSRRSWAPTTSSSRVRSRGPRAWSAPTTRRTPSCSRASGPRTATSTGCRR